MTTGAWPFDVHRWYELQASRAIAQCADPIAKDLIRATPSIATNADCRFKLFLGSASLSIVTAVPPSTVATILIPAKIGIIAADDKVMAFALVAMASAVAEFALADDRRTAYCLALAGGKQLGRELPEEVREVGHIAQTPVLGENNETDNCPIRSPKQGPAASAVQATGIN
jgi:hypothetical protein